MDCVCKKHKDELRSLSLDELNSKFLEELLTLENLNKSLENQFKIVNILFNELESRK